jgi:UDP-N-acetylglucosamine diphosphorylase/glucosamine-1-phosphate N-acetyltransferase
MALTICFFEDNSLENFYPLTYLRPIYTLRAGMFELFKRQHPFDNDTRIILTCRENLSPLISKSSDYPVNIIKKDGSNILFVNGRLKDWGNLSTLIKQNNISTRYTTSTGETAAVLIRNEIQGKLPTVTTTDDFQKLYEKEIDMIPATKTSASLYNYCWELVAGLHESMVNDFEYLKKNHTDTKEFSISDGAYLVNKDDIILSNGVKLAPGSVIDATEGPVYIGENSVVDSHAAIYGPCFIDHDSRILAGKVSGSSIGPVCRVGGEVEESIFQSYVNKYHDGFIGHSYVGSWVNFGAMTTNSDLKNNYSNIRVSLNENAIETGLNKVGSFIGDHTKFGIGTLLNTGINIGICCNVFGGGVTTDKEIPSFKWGGNGNYLDYKFDKVIETAEVVMQRRGVELSKNEQDVLESVSSGKPDLTGVMNFNRPGKG